jgi:peptidyl-prolyl cis-trans isomerase D
VPSAPAPLQSIRDRVAGDWLNSEASRRARAVAVAIDAKVRRGVPLAQALKEAGTPLPAVRPMAARRIEIANAQGVVPPPLRMLFSLTSGKSGMAADPQGRGFFIVKVGKIVPGNALLQPALISRMQNELQQAAAQDYASQFLSAIREQMKIRRNESAIAANKQRLITGGS